ncbi:MAG: hydroxymethylbilane synthase [Candidatus Omnitrophica bacterium]|nr:hydroxymethylbilane synthase [Candidatus Omnitrophota bacterium]MBU0896133.1 hydroxymethylbilane synthase [Candidatus Omnitrophota bacterium]MBU1134106.1 hydroxymethylbilane synthase [Candidatus Omnitrophota bacterium]MBU1367126.1 hydroxymethylbilane synthase [Candidatus Omnitrophota bacterium]MBU1523702.1 hydroxymethylbilane synthase [Candidatus Omnitrophota bacterium]
MAETYRIGTRTSPLALRQVEEVLGNLRKFYSGFKAEIVGIDTYGDRDKSTPISEIEGTDFFTKEIDEALLNSLIDFAVHSAKDLQDKLKEGLVVAGTTFPIDPYDVLVSKSGLTLDDLPFGAKIGTSSKRRKEGLKKFRPDFQIVDIRGNIQERLRLVDSLSFIVDSYKLYTINHQPALDAIVIAAAGLMRLGLEERITQRIPFEIITPHSLQGSLAVVTRKEDLELVKLLSVIDSQEVALL